MRNYFLRLIKLFPMVFAASCSNLDKLAYIPKTTPQQWCELRPCIDMGGFVLNEPLGSFLVFALAFLWIASGVWFLKKSQEQKSRFWFGISLVLGGVGATLAGISYQAFSYELKCAGLEFCKLTNGFEVGYSVTQAVSASAMLAAVAFALTKGKFRSIVLGYCILNTIVYVGLTIVGLSTLNKTLLSFELLMLFALPSVLFVIAISGPKYFRSKSKLDASLFWAAILFILVQVAYFGYFAAGITQTLWKNGTGFYFSENDVLHVGMILWLWYIITAVGRELRDS
ncbi:MAG: hypothetical protein KDK41_13575 [Leptospiraceae bacterium]|nr:hypothetical protein [Leptospiraceae bacterium]